VAEAIMQNSRADVESDPTRCAFGQFLLSPENVVLEQNWPQYKSYMETVRTHHDSLHRSVIQINNTASAQRKMHLYRTETQNELNMVEDNFASILDLENSLVSQQNEALTLYRDETLVLLDAMARGIGSAQEIIDKDSLVLQTEMQNALKLQTSVIWAGILTGFVLAVLLGFFLTRSIAGNLKKNVFVTGEVSRGNLNVDFDRQMMQNGDETGILTRSMSKMVRQLSDVLHTVAVSARNIQAGSEQLSSTSTQISSGANNQASNTEEISSSMEELAASIQQNSDNADKSDQIAKKASEDAALGGDAVNATVDAMKAIAEKISVINEIARNTNLLALNAAIEAARAGEVGKGFAVVASEVRKLAENSQKAAAEITDIATDSVHTAEKAGTIINRLVPDIQKTAELVQEISMASQEQNRGSEQINTALNQLNQIIQQNASASEEMASMSEELSSQAEQLNQAIGFFDLSDSQTLEQLSPRKQIAEREDDRDPDSDGIHSPVSMASESGKAQRATVTEVRREKASPEGQKHIDVDFEEF
jgi:methyl-accepting chemotaxis protein